MLLVTGFGFMTSHLLIVSSTLRIKHAASTAAWMALTLTRLGSHTKAVMLSRTPSKHAQAVAALPQLLRARKWPASAV